ncbi:hypothetical protein D3C86_1628330 [compost metagenome]
MTEDAVSRIKVNPHRNPLDDFGEVAGGVLRWQHAELRTAGRREAVQMTVEFLAR